jgi:hypothetical protein
MKRIVIASLAALGVMAAPALAVTTTNPPAKVAKQNKKALHAAKTAPKPAAKPAKKTN